MLFFCVCSPLVVSADLTPEEVFNDYCDYVNYRWEHDILPTCEAAATSALTSGANPAAILTAVAAQRLCIGIEDNINTAVQLGELLAGETIDFDNYKDYSSETCISGFAVWQPTQETILVYATSSPGIVRSKYFSIHLRGYNGDSISYSPLYIDTDLYVHRCGVYVDSSKGPIDPTTGFFSIQAIDAYGNFETQTINYLPGNTPIEYYVTLWHYGAGIYPSIDPSQGVFNRPFMGDGTSYKCPSISLPASPGALYNKILPDLINTFEENGYTPEQYEPFLIFPDGYNSDSVPDSTDLPLESSPYYLETEIQTIIDESGNIETIVIYPTYNDVDYDRKYKFVVETLSNLPMPTGSIEDYEPSQSVLNGVFVIFNSIFDILTASKFNSVLAFSILSSLLCYVFIKFGG